MEWFKSLSRHDQSNLPTRDTSHDCMFSLETRALALAIAAKLPVAVKIGKQAFYKQAQMTTAEAYAYAGEVMVQNMLDAATDEGITAFLEKRKPDWD